MEKGSGAWVFENVSSMTQHNSTGDPQRKPSYKKAESGIKRF